MNIKCLSYCFVFIVKNILMLASKIKKSVKLTVPILALLTVFHLKDYYGNVYNKCKLVIIPE